MSTNDDTRTYSLTYPAHNQDLLLNLCEDCLKRRLGMGAVILNKTRPAFPTPCEDEEAEQGRTR